MSTRSFLTLILLAAFLAVSAIGLSQDAEPAAELTFGRPTSTAVIGGCGYNAKTCANTSRYHTGVDYRNSEADPYVYAANRGKVVRVELVNWDDMGMGTNLILQHELASGQLLYTTYSHLSAIEPGIEVGTIVAKGQRIATMGGSGNGEANYWPIHLHFEVKDAAVTHNPSGPGIYWGYTPSHPNNFGYHDPNSIYGTVEVKPPAASALVLLSPNKGRLKRGFNVSVEWVADGASEGDEVTIYLKRDRYASLALPDGRNYAVLAQGERNDGSFRASVPVGLAPARDWRVYVKLDGSGLSDASDSRLRIK